MVNSPSRPGRRVKSYVIDCERSPLMKLKFWEEEVPTSCRPPRTGKFGAAFGKTFSKISESVAVSPSEMVSRSSLAVNFGSAAISGTLSQTTSTTSKPRVKNGGAGPLGGCRLAFNFFHMWAKFCLWIRLAQVFTCSVTIRPERPGSTFSFRSSHSERSVVVFAVVGGGKISRVGLTGVMIHAAG